MSPHSHHHAHDHAHAHAHAHGAGAHHAHDHGHSHEARAFGVGVVLNLGLVIAEVVYGILAHSMALLADAGHNMGDVLGLVLASAAALLARRRPTKHRTYGYRRLTVVAALTNSVLLLVATGGVMWESIRRLGAPEAVDFRVVIWVALAGAAVNAGSALLFLKGRRDDLNVRAAFVHLLADAAVSLAVVAASLLIGWTGWTWVDPLASIGVSLLILFGTFSLLRRSMNLVLDAVPEGIDIDAVRTFLERLPCVREVHDLHVWAMSTTETALTAHLVMPSGDHKPEFLGGACRELHDRFGIEHATLQIDPEEAPDPCRLASEETV